MNAWSPEPWAVFGRFVRDAGGCAVTSANHNGNALRIASCVNACAGMDDPAAEIARLRECERLLRRTIEWWETCDGNPMPQDIYDAARRATRSTQNEKSN